MTRRLPGVTIATAALVGLVGCSSASTSDVGTPAASLTHTVTDVAGRTVELPVHVTTVATVGAVPVLNSYAFAVGHGDAIVNGIPAKNVDGYVSYQVMAPRLLTAPTVQAAIGQEFDSEKLLEAHPDAVLTLTADMADAVEQLGIPAVVLSSQSGDDIHDSMRVVGEVFGEQERAAEYLTYFDDIIARVNKTAATIPDDQRRTVLFLDTRPLRRPNLVMDWMLDQVGATSVTHDVPDVQYPFEAEQLLAWDPQVLIGTRPYVEDDLTADPRYATLTAVQDGSLSVAPMGVHNWGQAVTEQPVALLWVARQVYPQYFADVDLDAETKYFYEHFYGIDLTDQNVSDLLAGTW